MLALRQWWQDRQATVIVEIARRLDESHGDAESFQQIVWRAMMSESTVERRCRKTLATLAANARQLVLEVERGDRPIGDLVATVEQFERSVHVITKGILKGPL